MPRSPISRRRLRSARPSDRTFANAFGRFVWQPNVIAFGVQSTGDFLHPSERASIASLDLGPIAQLVAAPTRYSPRSNIEDPRAARASRTDKPETPASQERLGG